jgi:hypothetical protein
MLEAIRLVKEDEFSVKTAAAYVNDRKLNAVPRMTLTDRLRKLDPDDQPTLGRPVELSAVVEEALVKCLEMCAEFNFPLKKRNLQDLVQNYCVENNVKTRWPNDRPGIDWVDNFRRRWRHRVKVRKPTNIRRSRAKVSPADVRAFFQRVAPNLEGISSYCLFNYDESPFRDDPGAEDAFFSVKTRHCEQVQNHSKNSFSVMFCCRYRTVSSITDLRYRTSIFLNLLFVWIA